MKTKMPFFFKHSECVWIKFELCLEITFYANQNWNYRFVLKNRIELYVAENLPLVRKIIVTWSFFFFVFFFFFGLKQCLMPQMFPVNQHAAEISRWFKIHGQISSSLLFAYDIGHIFSRPGSCTMRVSENELSRKRYTAVRQDRLDCKNV